MLLIYPAEQAAEYSFNCIPSVKSWSDVRAFQSMSMLAAICFLVLYSIKLAVEAEKAALVLPSEADKGRVVRSGYLLMDGLMWLLVSFFPLTGIVFRLGTLLAERLLFLPSVGFCLVQSYLLYHLTKRLMKHMSTSNLAQKTCFYSVAAVIVSFYIQKAREYNPHWKNDASLFLHTVHVCPNSAKSQLQVSKLYSMSINDPYLNLTLAWHHLNRSIEIDPDFCDNDFQRAYLNVLHANTLQLGQSTMLVYDNYISTAIEHLLGNLQCVFTNNKAVELLNKLWAHQVEYTKAFSANKQDTQTSETQLLVKQAKQAYKFQLYSLAAQRFLELGTALYEKNQLQEAIKYTIYADRAIVSYYNFTGKANLTGFANSAIQNFDNMFGSTTSWFSAGQSEALMLYVMQCRAWSLLAGMIHHHYNVSSSLLHQQGKEYASKGSCLECLFVAAKVNKNILEPYHLPMNHIRIASNLQVMQIMKEHGELVGKNYDNVETNVILKYALSLTTLAMLDSNRQLLSQAYSAWNIAASRHYKDNSYVQSSQYYLIALLLGLDPAPLVHIQYYALVVFSSPAVSVDHHSQFFATYNHSMVYNYKKMQDCHSLYLYADSLAGRKELFQSSDAVSLVRDLLVQFQTCLKDKAKMTVGAGQDKKQIQIVQYLVDKFDNYTKAFGDAN
ncbi:DUF1736 domain-containing protein [archaeon]|nr:MAG: DUF1736 domain-containing protein [archaeon]